MDEKVIELINQREIEKDQKLREEQISQSIQMGSLEMKGQIIIFEERKLLDDKIALRLPKDFGIMPPETVALKYPAERRPGLVFTNEAGAVNITFSHTQTTLENDGVQRFRDYVIQTIRKMQPAVEWVADGLKNKNEKNIGYFEFIAPALDTNIYNFLSVTELDKQALIINLNCPEEEMDEWRPIAKGILDTLATIEGGGKEEPENIPRRDFSGCRIKYGSFGIHHGKEYQLFKMGDNEYRLISFDGVAQEDGFKPKDGVFKKTVIKSEIEAAYQIKPIIVYQGYQFEMRQELKNEVQLVKGKYEYELAYKFEMKNDSQGVFTKWIDKSEIEDIVEEYSSVEDFPMPEPVKQ
jgi:hypothetical protein